MQTDADATYSDNKITFVRDRRNGWYNNIGLKVGAAFGSPVLGMLIGITNELSPQISGNALKLFCALTNCLDYSDDAIVEMSAVELQTITGLSEHTVRRSLNELEDLGLIKRIGANARRKYVVNERHIPR